jgi:DNA adenine methylase
MRFLRYPGGKTKQLMFLTNYLPKSDDINGRYIEPFVGGGSVFLSIQPRKAIISDLNYELVELYRGIRNYPHKVWQIFESLPAGKDAYYQIRDEEYRSKPLWYRAARTLFLNRTCFKGMWRHNPQGDFNVGYGGESRRWVITHENIVELSGEFKRADILHSDFEPILGLAQDDDFIFLDPPYKPGYKQMREAHYANGNFSFKDQTRLSKMLGRLSKMTRAKWLMTNSSHPEICGLYNNCKIKKVPMGTSNVIGVQTSDSNEVIISNY